jgi:hypothetical protein
MFNSLKNAYLKDVRAAIRNKPAETGIVTESRLKGLPDPVQRYLRFSGVPGRERCYNMRLVFKGRMREKGKGWFNFSSEQYNFFETPARFFYMKARLKGVPASGYHSYKLKQARMRVRMAGLIPVVNLDTPEMFPTETVTYFNDLCMFAPAALLDERIQWEPIDSLSARAVFTNQGSSIRADLYFNSEGQLTNFVSQDRISIADMKAYPFSTPVGDYRDFDGFRLPGYGEAVWHYPEGEFVYGEFKVVSLQYNV